MLPPRKLQADREDFMAITRRSIVAGAVLAPFLTAGARAQNWPSGIIKIIVPFPPGGTVDPMARLAQPGLQARLGATIIIENRPGASGSAGTAAVAKSAPDGHTLPFVFATHAVNPFLQNLSFYFFFYCDGDPRIFPSSPPRSSN